MTLPRDVHPVLVRPWVAVAGGAVAGVVLATAVIVGWGLVGARFRDVGQAAARPDTAVDVFRLPPGAAFEMLVAPAGPDAQGETEIAERLFPGEEPPRRLAAVLVANTGALGDWEVDLAAPPLRARFGGADWVDLAAVDAARTDALGPALALRFRSLGGVPGPRRIEPGTMRRFLLALPPGRTLEDASGVQWGDRVLRRESMDLESFHAFRESPVHAAAER